MFKRSRLDTKEGIAGTIRANIVGFQGLEENNNRDVVKRYRPKIERKINDIDVIMTRLISEQENSVSLMSEWLSRVKECLIMLTTIDNNLKHGDSDEWHWDSVIDAMSYIEAVCNGARLTLWDNDVDFNG